MHPSFGRKCVYACIYQELCLWAFKQKLISPKKCTGLFGCRKQVIVKFQLPRVQRSSRKESCFGDECNTLFTSHRGSTASLTKLDSSQCRDIRLPSSQTLLGFRSKWSTNIVKSILTHTFVQIRYTLLTLNLLQ